MSTTREFDVEVKPERPKRRRLPRLSLLSFLLAAALICVSVSHFRQTQENGRLQKRHNELLKKSGFLVIHDPNKVYLQRVESLDGLTWRFQIYLPPKKQFCLCTRASHIGVVCASGIIHDNEQMMITVGIRRNAKGAWELKTLLPKSAMSMGADTEIAEKLQNLDFPFMLEEQKELDPDKPFDLVQYFNGDFNLWIEPGSGPSLDRLRRNVMNQPK